MPAEIPTHLDLVKNTKGLIDLDSNTESLFGLGEYVLEYILDDIILAEFIDEMSDGSGEAIQRNGLFIPTSTLTKAWRKAKVLIAGPNVKYCKVGDIIIFPNDKGLTVTNLDIKMNGEVYKVGKGTFLNEQRIFGVCSEVSQKKGQRNANRKRSTKVTTTK